MVHKNNQRKVQLYYDYDRLSRQKVSQVYQLLVPQKTCPCQQQPKGIHQKGILNHEHCGNLRSGIIG
ncbi:MAG: hypothetical protein E3K37_04925 [Candidatus Kuenenia sp.]|nr:hypothetical protein [Candidatus Kuenenia hertensis]